MGKRTIIEIDQELCDGCGSCETGCPEGALKIIDGKARLVGESLCDGLGACIGRCPKEAIRVIEREAGAYDEAAGVEKATPMQASAGRAAPFPDKPSGRSSLKNWPIQLHLANPRAPHFADADLLVAADCTAFALGSFHADIIGGRTLVIACTKLDSGRNLYLSELAAMIGQARSVSVVVMEVPCCSGLVRLAQEARSVSGAPTPIQTLVLGIDGGLVAQKVL
jgi:NAD-dependent dihydropyrimidine dehydrogenase PreA subunit